jgi:nucleotide-binding universal stress UspA family protein
VHRHLDARAESILRAFHEQCEAAGILPELKKATGVIDETIIEEGRRCCDWVLLAQRGEHFHLGDGAILGSTAQSVVRRSGKPVLVIPAQFREITRMALAYDGSAPAENALKLAAELFQQTSWPLSIVIISDDQTLAEKRTQKARDFLAPLAIDCTVLIRKGKEDKELLRFIQEQSADLLVMGAYGHNRLRELLLGGTTSSVIRKSTIPVLLTR